MTPTIHSESAVYDAVSQIESSHPGEKIAWLLSDEVVAREAGMAPIYEELFEEAELRDRTRLSSATKIELHEWATAYGWDRSYRMSTKAQLSTFLLSVTGIKSDVPRWTK